jgi:hypothetical protein
MPVKIVRLVLANVLVLLFSLIGLDIFLWIFFPINAEGTPIEKIYHQDIPGVKSTVVYKRNQFGLRSLSMVQYEKPHDVIRIFCIGASTTQQITQETADTWCGLLQSHLERKYQDSGFRFETAAYGGGGEKAVDAARYIVEYIDRIDPDIVVTLLGVNDMAFTDGQKIALHSPESIQSGSGQSLKDYLRQYSQIRRRYHWIKLKRTIDSGEVIVRFNDQLPRLRSELKAMPYTENLQRDPDPIDAFAGVIEWIAQSLEDKGIALILMGQPTLWDQSMSPAALETLWFGYALSGSMIRTAPELMLEQMTRYNSEQGRVAQAHGNTRYVDLDALIPKSLDFYFDDCHFTDLGSVAVAEAVSSTLDKAVEVELAQRQLGD